MRAYDLCCPQMVDTTKLKTCLSINIDHPATLSNAKTYLSRLPYEYQYLHLQRDETLSNHFGTELYLGTLLIF